MSVSAATSVSPSPGPGLRSVTDGLPQLRNFKLRPPHLQGVYPFRPHHTDLVPPAVRAVYARLLEGCISREGRTAVRVDHLTQLCGRFGRPYSRRSVERALTWLRRAGWLVAVPRHPDLDWPGRARVYEVRGTAFVRDLAPIYWTMPNESAGGLFMTRSTWGGARGGGRRARPPSLPAETVRAAVTALGGFRAAAAHLGVPRSTLARWAQGGAVPDEHAARLAEAAGAPPAVPPGGWGGARPGSGRPKTDPDLAKRFSHDDYNRLLANVRKARARARAAGYAGDAHFNLTEWVALLDATGWRCLRCGATDDIAADHVIPVKKGGTNSIDNVQPLCVPCNSAKGSGTTDYRAASHESKNPSRKGPSDPPGTACPANQGGGPDLQDGGTGRPFSGRTEPTSQDFSGADRAPRSGVGRTNSVGVLPSEEQPTDRDAHASRSGDRFLGSESSAPRAASPLPSGTIGLFDSPPADPPAAPPAVAPAPPRPAPGSSRPAPPARRELPAGTVLLGEVAPGGVARASGPLNLGGWSPPPYPGISTIRPATVPKPPLLDPDLPEKERVAALVRAFSAAAEVTYARDGAPGAPPPRFRQPPPRAGSALYDQLVAAADLLIDETIPPIIWAAWSIQRVWLGYSPGAQKRGKRSGRRKPPPLKWVYQLSRIETRAGWCGSEMGDYAGGRVLLTDTHRELLRRYHAFWAALLRERPYGRAAAQALFSRFFPGDLYERTLAKVRADAARDQAQLDQLVRDGRFVWL